MGESYRGNPPNFNLLPVQSGVGSGTAAPISLNYNPGSATAILFSINGALQTPNLHYTLVSQTLVPASAIPSGVPYVIYFLGIQTNISTPGIATVGPAQATPALLYTNSATAATSSNGIQYVATPATPIASYYDGLYISLKMGATNTSNTPTVNVSGVGVANIVSKDNTPLSYGQIGNNQTHRFIYTAAYSAFVLLDPIVTVITSDAMTNLLYPTQDAGWRDTLRSGWIPAWFNQQWGGAQWGGLPDGSNGDIATGNIKDNGANGVGNVSGQIYNSQGFKVSDNQTPTGVWLKIYKIGNPVDNFQVQCWSDNGSGAPSAALGVAGVISGKIITSKADGEWYFVPVTFPALVAGTQYHIVSTKSAGVDAANYYLIKQSSTKKYPNGFQNNGTSVPAWTAQATVCECFLIPNPAANQFLQSGGQFDAKFVFNNGNPVNQSKLLCQPMKNFFNGKQFTALIRGTGYAVSTPIADFAYGLDHERIAIQTNASGFVTVTYYPNSDTTAPSTITGSVNVTTANLKDIAIKGRFVGDGADYLYLYVNGVVDGTPLTAQTWSMSNNLRDLGTATLGGGFPLAPTWTVNTNATALAGLPSTAGWTWTGTGTEASCMSVAGGKLYQNANGYTSTQSGYYTRTTTLNNATGWSVSFKLREVTSPNTSNGGATLLYVYDGVKSIGLNVSEYFVQCYNAGTVYTVQGDFKSQDNVFVLSGKGADFYLHLNGKLLVDGTGQNTQSTASNQVIFGDMSTVAADNADAIYSYIKIYNGGMLLPVAHTGASLSEFACWSGDKSALLPAAYNSGTPISIKQLCGVERNYVGEGVVFSDKRLGVTSAPSTTSTTPVLVPELECYILGSTLSPTSSIGQALNNTAGNTITLENAIDGVNYLASQGTFQNSTSSYQSDVTSQTTASLQFGLHKVEGRYFASATTASMVGVSRQMTVTSKA